MVLSTQTADPRCEGRYRRCFFTSVYEILSKTALADSVVQWTGCNALEAVVARQKETEDVPLV